MVIEAALFFCGGVCGIATVIFIDFSKDIFVDAINDIKEYRRKKKLWKKYR